jgi:hypothetical protein
MKMTTRSLVNSVAISSIATLAAFSSIDRAQAATITGLFNTGVTAPGVVQADGTSDAHYTISSSPIGAGNAIARTTGFPVNAYLAPSSVSTWIGPNTANYYGNDGDYTYTTTFNVAGAITASDFITGKWATDNNGVAIKLNGFTVSIPTSSLSNSYSAFTPFTISSGFTSGLNTLEFVVNNSGGGPFNPTALRVELAAGTTAVPEPSDLVGTAIGFGAIVMLKRKFAKKTLG